MSANPQPRPLEPDDLDLMISRSLDGDLPGEEERELQSLLAASSAARARYEAMAGLVGRLEEIPDPETPFALATRVNAQVEADTKGLAATLHRFGFYFRPATVGVVVAGIVAVAIAYTVVSPQKPSATVAVAKSQPAPVDDGRVTVYLGPAEKAKAEAEAKGAPAAPAAGVSAANEARADARPGRSAESEPVLVASAETPREKKDEAFAPEADGSVAPSAPAALEESAARDAVAQKGAVAEGARLRAAAPAAAGASRPAAAGVEIVGRSAETLRLASPARLDGLAGSFEGNYRLELDASGRVADVVRLYGGSGAEPAALQVRLRALSFAPAAEAAAARSVDVRVRIP